MFIVKNEKLKEMVDIGKRSIDLYTNYQNNSPSYIIALNDYMDKNIVKIVSKKEPKIKDGTSYDILIKVSKNLTNFKKWSKYARVYDIIKRPCKNGKIEYKGEIIAIIEY